MYLSKIKEKIKLAKETGSPKGIRCTYVSLDNGWGIKIYDCKITRNNAYNTQYNVFCSGFAPKVGEKLDFEDSFAYLTEEVRPLIPHRIQKLGYDHKDWKRYSRIFNEYSSISLYEFTAQVSEASGEFIGDEHPGNFGILDGRLVAIDFS